MTTNGERIIEVKQFIKHPYAWPGGYPRYAVMSDGGVLCHTCVKEELTNIVTAIAQNIQDGWQVEGIDINWEDSSLYCDHCNQWIVPAYEVEKEQ